MKDTFGFLRCADREGDLYFSFQAAPRESLREGSCVEFIVEERGGKLSATALALLPDHSVTFESLLPGRHKGFVEKDLQGKGTGKGTGKSDSYRAREGAIQCEEAGSEAELVPYGADDVAREVFRGSEVEFSLVVEKVSQRRRATDVKLLRTARQVKEDAEAASAVKEEGVVRVLKEGFGFLESTSRSQAVFFRFADFVERSAFEVGTEVAFRCVPEKKRGDERRGDGRGGGARGSSEVLWRATHLALLPKGTVAFEELVEGAAAFAGSVASLVVRPGVVQLADGQEASFKADGLPRCGLKAGDQVAVGQLWRHKASHALIAKQLSLVALSTQGREQGVVSALKDGFGFVKSCQREAELYFRHRADCLDADAAMVEGTEVEFDVSGGNDSSGKGSGKGKVGKGSKGGRGDNLCAERIQILEPG
jgi:cold shock CspA family protein